MRKLNEFISLLRFNSKIGFEFSPCREMSSSVSADNHLRIAYLRESLAPLNKPNYYDFLVAKKPSLSSLSRDVVLVPISVRQERNKKRMFVQKSFFTFVKRADKIDTLEGLCSFVGGKRTNSDKDDVTTALREAHDQLGIDPKRLTILCQMSPVLLAAFGDHYPSSLVSPVIAFYDQDDHVTNKINAQKVEFAFEIETDRFLRVDEYRRKSSMHDNREHYFHYFNFALDPQQKRVNIWGMTSHLSIQIASILHSRVPSFEFDPERKLTGYNCNEFNEWYMLDKCGKLLDESIERAVQNYASKEK